MMLLMQVERKPSDAVKQKGEVGLGSVAPQRKEAKSGLQMDSFLFDTADQIQEKEGAAIASVGREE